MNDERTFEIGMVIFPRMTQLDLTGPHELLSKMPNCRVHLLWHEKEPVASDTGMQIVANQTFAECPRLDLVFVPGGPGSDDMLADDVVLGFLREQARTAAWVTSVCTGSLVLGAAGLLDGYRAGCHWASRHLLAEFGAIPDEARVVVDRNRVTGGGVTAGLDFGLVLVAQLKGEEVASSIQLLLEYDPEPPLNSGSPVTAPAHVLERVKTLIAPMLAKRTEKVMAAAQRLRG